MKKAYQNITEEEAKKVQVLYPDSHEIMAAFQKLTDTFDETDGGMLLDHLKRMVEKASLDKATIDGPTLANDAICQGVYRMACVIALAESEILMEKERNKD